MASSPPQAFDVVVVGAGPAGVVAALRAARLGARTALITRDHFGGMAANDGPVPVRTLAQAARLIREARQLPLYGIAGGEPSLDYPRLLARVRDVTGDVRRHTLLRGDLERAGVTIYEHAGSARFADARTVESDNAVRAALTASGVQVTEGAGTIDRFERCAAGVRLVHSAGDGQRKLDASLAVVAAGWVAATAGLDLDQAGVQTDPRGFVQVDGYLRTTAPHVFAAGDITGRALVVHEAVREGVVAATNAVLGPATVLPAQVSPVGSFTDPEYASVGLTEAAARETRDVTVAAVRFDSLPRPIIDGRPAGFCKLVVDRESHSVLGCHVVGERAVELVQLAATAMAAQMPVEQLALVPFSFPTYANALARAAIGAAVELDQTGMWAVEHLVTSEEAGVA